MDKERREILKKIQKLVDPYRITKGKGFRLKDIDPGDTGGFGSDQKPPVSPGSISFRRNPFP
ncbi:MAG TPA: hypothetical protein VFB91_04885, partial [Terriglobales bacterium]|nr:hypothetical protein [Terriglobales bacterium]